jgi:hypothetical protein
MRTSQTVTDVEIRAYADFCAKHHIIHDNSKNDEDNANFILDYFLNKWNADITQANLSVALPKIREYLNFYTPTEAAYQKLAAQMTEAEKQTVHQWFSRQRLAQDGDTGLQNQTNLVSWLKEKNFEVTSRNLDLALSNVISKGHFGHPILAWKSVEPKKQEREVSDAEIATWRSRAEGVVVRTPSGLVINGKTEEVRRIVVNGEDGTVDWRLTAQARELAASRK